MGISKSVKSYLRELVGLLLLLLWYLRGRKCERTLSLYFHNPSEALFDRIIRFFSNHRYQFLPLEKFIAELSKKEENLSQNKSIFISFDDGWQKNLNLVPILERYRVPITLFVSTEPLQSGNYWWEYALVHGGHHLVARLKHLPYLDFVSEVSKIKSSLILGRSAMTQKELYDLAQHPLVEVHSHTHTHPILTMCPDNIISYELQHSLELLNKMLNIKSNAFSYPNGSYNDQIVTHVAKAGYKYAFTTESTPIEHWKRDWLRIPRRSINDYGGYYENIAKALGLWPQFFGR